MNYQHILFDLDGTLADPKRGIVNSFAHALECLNMAPLSTSEIEMFIGPPLHDSFRSLVADETEVEQAVSYYRDYFGREGVYENELYPGIRTLLQELGSQGVTLHIATSKPTIYARKVAEVLEIGHLFEMVHGGELDGAGSDKAAVIGTVLSRLGDIPPDDCLMVGDRKYDLIGAAAHHVEAVGVTYGYGTPEELKLAGALCTCDSVEELRRFLYEVS